MPRFAFLIHPLAPWHRRLLGARRLHGPALLGGRADSDLVGPIAEIRMESRLGPIEGRVIGVPDLASLLVEDQARALLLEERAMQAAVRHGCEVIGLGNALAVVASRGKELQRLAPVPVTTGHASTAWCCAEITRLVAAERSRGPIGVLGFAGTVGDAVAAKLRADGYDVRVDATGPAAIKRAAALGAIPGTIDDVLGACRLVVGASTTGPIVSPTKVRPGTVLVDLALPPTLMPGPLPAGFRAVKGEALRFPGRFEGWFWGRIWHAVAGYGRGCVYACVAEPAMMAITGERGFSDGRKLEVDQLEAAGRALLRVGFAPIVRSL